MLTKKPYRIKCDECGQFISLDDLISGRATHFMSQPDSEVNDETYESECRKCKENDDEVATD